MAKPLSACDGLNGRSEMYILRRESRFSLEAPAAVEAAARHAHTTAQRRGTRCLRLVHADRTRHSVPATRHLRGERARFLPPVISNLRVVLAWEETIL